MKKLYLIVITLLIVMLGSCTKLNREYKLNITNNLMSKNIDDEYRVFYQIFIGSFSDSNKDGIGDLRGIINRFDYLNDGDDNSGMSLGIEGIWLSPMMPSNSYHKYDVKNYMMIDPKFGTLDDFIELLELAHSRNVKIIIDLVVNHTSRNHPWFMEYKKARENNDLTNPYYDYYTTVHKDDLDLNKTYYPIYSGSEYYYEGNFSSEMPELNFDNENVKNEFEEIVKFWLDLGVDGFRLDAAKFIYYHETDKNIVFWEWFIEMAKSYKEDVYVVGEVWSSEREILEYYKNFNNFDFSFAELDGYIAQTARATMSVDEYTFQVKKYLDRVNEINNEAIISPFISNHDMDRAAGYLLLDDGLMYMAANLYILGPGNPYIYYGEEIGLKGFRGNANTDANRRLVMPWGDKDSVKNPVGTSYDESLQINGTVKKHLKDKDSLYNHYKKLIQIRKAVPEIARGGYLPLETNIYTVGGFISSYQGRNILVLHNTGFEQKTINLNNYTNITFNDIVTAVGKGEAHFNSDDKTLVLDGLTSVIIKD